MNKTRRISIGAASLFLLMPASAALAQFTFDSAVSYPVTGARPDGVAALDYDGDGDLDIAVVTDTQQQNRDRIEIFRNNGAGVLASAFEINLPNSSSPGDLEAADFDRDGDPDLAVVLKDFSQVMAVINNGGSFTLGATAAIGTEGIGMSQGDMDGDGEADLIVANRESNTATVLRNNGNATFASITLNTQQEPRAGTFFDLENDGDLDAAVTNHDSRSISLFRNDGGAYVGAGTLSVGSSVRPEGITSADLNGDGREDLAANIGDDGIEWIITFMNQGGSFSGSNRWVTNGIDGSEVLAADLDGDGSIDLASLNATSDNMSLLRNNGAGTFGGPQLFATGNEPDKFLAANLDGDGDLDIVASNKLSNTISVFINHADDGGQAVEADLQSVSVQIGQRIGGQLGALRNVDGRYFRVESELVTSGPGGHQTQIVVTAVSPDTTIQQLDLSTMTRVNMPGVATKIWLRNWDTNRWVLIDQFSQPMSDTQNTYAEIAHPNAYVNDADGRIQVRIRVSNTLDQFEAFYNLVELMVTE